MSDQHSSDPPRTPQKTWTTLSSSSRPDSYSSEDASSERNMRRIIVSPPPTDYDEEANNSLTDSAEVEAALAALDDEIDTTQDALSAWGSHTLDPYNFQPRPLSIITERTEDPVSRSASMRTSTFGPLPPRTPVTPAPAANPPADAPRAEHLTPRSLTPSSLTHSHSQASADSGGRNPSPERSLRHTPRRRAGDLIAFFEDKSSSDSSLSSLGQIRSRSPTLTTFTPPSHSLPALSRDLSEGLPPSYSSLPRSTTLPSLVGSRSASPTKSSGASLSSLLSPVRGTGSIESRPAVSTTPISTKQPLQLPGEPRSPLSSVRNIVAAWKERTPSLGKSSKPPSTTSAGEEGFFSIRRRDAGATDRSLPPLPQESLSRQNSNGNGRRKSGTSAGSGSKPPFDLAELGPFAQSDRDPLRIGQLWYLNVHATPPYRWLRTQAILYPHVLILSWIAPGGGRGVITLDLLNCNEVRSVPSPSHPSAHDDIGTVAAREQAESSGPEGALVETLCPFQLLYPDGVERLGAESARERVRWVGAIWEALNRAVSFPDPSTRSRSPAPSIRTIRSESSTSSGENRSKSGSASTVFVPPLDTIPDLPSSTSSVSSRSSAVGSHAVFTPASLDDAGFHHLRASDDGAISNAGILYPLERKGSKVIAPSRSSSLRRTSSLADLDAEFASAVSRSAGSSVGSPGKPVTVSSGPSETGDVFVSPPPSAGKKSRAGMGGKSISTSTSASESGESGGVGYLTPPSRISARTTPTSSYYSLPISPLRPRTESGLGSGTGTGTSHVLGPRGPQSVSSDSVPHVVTSTLSLRGSRSASLLGDSHDGDNSSDITSNSSFTPSPVSNTPTSSKRGLLAAESPVSRSQSGSSLSRSPGVRRRTPRKTSSRATSSSSAGTEYGTPVEGSDKENETGMVSEAYNTASRGGSSTGVSTPTERSYRPVGAQPSTPTPTSHVATPSERGMAQRTRTSSYDSIGYDVCPSSDLSELTPMSSTMRRGASSVLSESDSDVESRMAAPLEAGESLSDVVLSIPERTTRTRTLTPTSTTFTTASGPPSSTEYSTASTCESSEYRTLSSGPFSMNYQTAEMSTEFETAEVCSSEASTRYLIPEYASLNTRALSGERTTPSLSLGAPTPPPSKSPTISSPTTSSLGPVVMAALPREGTPRVSDDERSERMSAVTRSSKAPSTMRTIPSLPESSPRFVPSTRLSPASRPSRSSRAESEPVPVTEKGGESTVTVSSSSSSSIAISSSSATLSSVTSTSSGSGLTSSLSPTQPASSIPSIRESLYEETSGTYESSVLLPSPTLHSVAIQEGVDTSFDTSFLRPSDSVEPSESRVRVGPTTPPPVTPTLVSSSRSTMTRTPSSVSSISMRSSMISPDTESLYFDEGPSPLTVESSPSVSSPSSESSVTPETTVSTSTRSLTPTVPPSSPSSPSSPSTPRALTLRSSVGTPDPTFSVSISTPHSNAPSIVSQLETVPSHASSELAGSPPGEILTHDVNRLLQYLHEVDAVRNEQNVDMASHLDHIEVLLHNLATSLKEKSDKPPPVPTKDVSIGRSAVTRTPTPIPPPSPVPPPGQTTRSLSPPPERLPSPSSLLTSISWLSSHHSDDWGLMSTEEVRLLPQRSSSSSSMPSVISSSDAVSVGSSKRSVETVRPTMTLADIQMMIDVVLSEVKSLRDGQRETQDMLKDLRREPAEEHHSETSEQRRYRETISRTEDMLRRILDRLGSEAQGSVLSESSEGPDDTGLIDLFTRLLRPAPPPTSLPIHAPSPAPPLPSMSDLFPDIGIPSAPAFPIQLEPLPTIQRPRTRQRHRSVSPPLIEFRPGTAPVPSSDGVVRAIPPFQRPPSTGFTPVRSTFIQPDAASRRERPLPDLPRRAAARDSPDMYEIVRRDRGDRRGDTDAGVFIPAGQPRQQHVPPLHEVPHRLPSAPPSLGAAPPEGQSRMWYRPGRRASPAETRTMGDQPPSASGPGLAVPPPGVFIPAQGGPQPLGSFASFPGAAAAGAVPPREYAEILRLLRATHDAQTASIDQQNEIMRYMAGLNDWLERDVHDRHAELRGLGDRIDQLRNELAQRLGIRPAVPFVQVPGEGPIIPPPPGQWFGAPPGPPLQGGPPQFYSSGGPFVVPPPGFVREESSEDGSPFIPPPLGRPSPGREQFPPGFVPYAGPGVPSRGAGVYTGQGRPQVTVVSPSSRASTPEEGFIPPRPSGTPAPITVVQPGADQRAPPVIIPPPAGSRPGSPGQRPGEIVVIPPPSERSRSRSRSRTPVIIDQGGSLRSSRRSSRERDGPQQIIIRPSSRSRSRPRSSRGPSVTHVVDRSRSRSRAASYRSHGAPAPIVIRDGRSRSRTRSRSPTPPPAAVFIRGGSRSRSTHRHSPPATQPVIIESNGRRSRSRSSHRPAAQPIVIRPRSRSRSSRDSYGRAPSQPIVVDTSRRRSRSSRRSPSRPVIIGTRTRSRTRSRSTPRQVLVVPEDDRSRSHHSHHPPAVAFVGDPDRRRSRTRSRGRETIIVGDSRGRRSRSRTPERPTIIMGGSRGRSRTRSRERPPIIVGDPDRRRSRTRSRGRETIIVGDPDRHHSRTHSRERPAIIMGGSRGRSRSRSRGRETIIVGDPDRHHSRTHSRERPAIIMGGSRGRSRSRSRGRETIIVGGPDRHHSRTHSRERPAIIMGGSRGRSRSRSRGRETIIVGDPDRHSRTHSRERPAIVMGGSRGRSRSRSRGRETIIVGDPDRHHSRTHSRERPAIIMGGSRGRSRSRSRERPTIVMGGSRDRSRTRSRERPTIIMGDPDSRSRRPSRAPTVIVPDSSRSRRHSSGEPLILGSRHGSRSPSPELPVVVPRSPSRHGRRSPTIVVRGRSPSRDSRITVAEDPHRRGRSPAHSHAFIPTRSRTPSPSRHVLQSRPGSRASRHSYVTVPGPSEEPVFHDDGLRPPPRHHGSPIVEGDQPSSPPHAPPTVIQVRQRSPAVSVRSRPHSEIRPVIDSQGRPLYDDHDQGIRRAHTPTVIPDDDLGYEHDRMSRRPSHASSVLIPAGTPPRASHPAEIQEDDTGIPRYPRPEIQEGDAGAPHRPPLSRVAAGPSRISPGAITTSEQDGHLLPVSRTSPRSEGGPAAERPMEEYGDAPDHPPSEPVHPHEGERTPRHPSTPEVDSQILIPTGLHPQPSDVVIQGNDLAEAFNNAEDERRARHQAAEQVRDEKAAEAEVRRDREFLAHEEERQRIFEEGERRRNETSEDVRQAIFQAAEGERDIQAGEADSVRAASIRSAIEDVASQLGTVRTKDWEDERARLNEENEQKIKALQEDWENERARLKEEHEKEVQALQEEQKKMQEEFVTLRDTTEAERIERERVETERNELQQMELLQRDSSLRDQLTEITGMLREKKVLCDERWTAKEERRGKKDADFQELKDLVKGIMEDNEKTKAAAAEEKERDEQKPGIDAVLEALDKAYAEQKATIENVANAWLKDSEKQHMETLDAVRSTAQEQVPFNVQTYLEQFSRSLADEVRMLLGEVGKLREEKRNIQYELGCLMCMRSKYGPSGEFDPNWKPTVPPFAWGDGGPPPPGGGPPPGDVQPEQPPSPKASAWRAVNPPAPPKLSKRQRRLQKEEAAAAAAAGPSGPPGDTRSWATWQPHPHYAPSPPSQEPELVVPERPIGLFGPRSPQGSFMK